MSSTDDIKNFRTEIFGTLSRNN